MYIKDDATVGYCYRCKVCDKMFLDLELPGYPKN